MQREITILSEAKRPLLVSEDLIRSCRTKLDAVLLCIQLSRLSHETIADQLGLNKGNFCRMLQGRLNLPTNKENDLMNLCGNYAPMQWTAMTNGFDLQERAKDVRIAELEAELQELKYG